MRRTSILLAELKRRKVFRVAAMYAVAGWVLLQVGEVTFEPLGFPEGSLRTLILIVAMGFPIAIVLGWVFDWTSEGVVRTSAPDPSTEHPIRSAILLIGALLLAGSIGYGGYRGYTFWSQVRWAQDFAQPELARKIDLNDFAGAFELASELEETVGVLPALEPVWRLISARVGFQTEPPGAQVSYRRYDDPAASWQSLGETPIDSSRVPRGASLWRIEKPGYVTRTFARLPANDGVELARWPSQYILDTPQESPSDSVPVEGREYLQVSLSGFPVAESYELDRFFIDRTEVTNQDYQEFVTAGGYRRSEFWTEPLIDGDRTLSFEEAMERFQDSTGRPGPATWIAGRYPEGQAEYPVGGVSWFEAVAYARFRGRHLPTAYHWAAAALPDIEIMEPLAPELAAQSNLGSEGPLPVGSTTGLSAAGASDMFGNVAEWVWTARSDDKRFILGVSWQDPGYNASLAAAASPWSRLATQGLRLATYPSGLPDASLLAPVEVTSIDYESLESVSDEALAMLRQINTYRPGPLRSNEANVDLPNGMSAIRAEIDAPFSDVKLPIYLLMPENASPPYQAVIWFGGMNAVITRDNTSLYQADMRIANFLRQSGRVVAMPIWTGAFERNDGSTFRHFMGSGGGQTEIAQDWSRDLRIAMDYLETRGDIDTERVAFVGLSLGAAIGATIVPSEERLRTAIYWSGGFAASSPASTSRLTATLARETKLPLLMLNGRYDFVFPLESQQAFFRMLGTPAEHKRHVVFDAGHLGWPLGEFVRENLDWLDRYLGQVTRPAT